jgi:hypothetical protein
MKRFVEGDDRKQVALLPECVDDYTGQDNPVRVIDAFVNELALARSRSRTVQEDEEGVIQGVTRPITKWGRAAFTCSVPRFLSPSY